jgi:hypothetical protein
MLVPNGGGPRCSSVFVPQYVRWCISRWDAGSIDRSHCSMKLPRPLASRSLCVHYTSQPIPSVRSPTPHVGRQPFSDILRNKRSVKTADVFHIPQPDVTGQLLAAEQLTGIRFPPQAGGFFPRHYSKTSLES